MARVPPLLQKIFVVIGAASLVPNTVSLIDDTYTQMYFFQCYLIIISHVVVTIDLLDSTEVNRNVLRYYVL